MKWKEKCKKEWKEEWDRKSRKERNKYIIWCAFMLAICAAMTYYIISSSIWLMIAQIIVSVHPIIVTIIDMNKEWSFDLECHLEMHLDIHYKMALSMFGIAVLINYQEQILFISEGIRNYVMGVFCSIPF